MSPTQLKRVCANHGYECYFTSAYGWTVYPADLRAEASYHTAATLKAFPNTVAGVKRFVDLYLSDPKPE